MKTLRFDLYSGFADDRRYTEKDSWVQCEGETLEDLAESIYHAVLANGEELINDEEGEDDDTD